MSRNINVNKYFPQNNKECLKSWLLCEIVFPAHFFAITIEGDGQKPYTHATVPSKHFEIRLHKSLGETFLKQLCSLFTCLRHHSLGNAWHRCEEEVLQKELHQKMARSLQFVLGIQQMSHLQIFIPLKIVFVFMYRKLLRIQFCQANTQKNWKRIWAIKLL